VNRAIFLDRDGILNDLVFYPSHGEWESPRAVSDLRMLPGIAAPLISLQNAGWLLFIVTNQPSFAKGKTSLRDLEEVESAVIGSLAREGVRITASYECFHHPEAALSEWRVQCECRKPGTLFLRRAAAEHDIALSQSWMAGDQDSDLACGRAAGCRVALIEYPHSGNKRGVIEPDLRCRNLDELARALC